MTYTTQTRLFKVTSPDAPAVHEAAKVLRAGGLVAFPTETVYGLGANALDAEAVARIFSAKERPASDPVIVHLYKREQLEQVALEIPEAAYPLVEKFWPGPLTLVLKRASMIPTNVSAGGDTVAVRMPNHPIALNLLKTADLPVAAPSANRFARPSATTAQHVLEDLEGRVDVILDSGPTSIGLESTVIDLTEDRPTILRPGGLLVETLREILPDIQIRARFLAAGENASAPGMLIKHYSPRAQLWLFTDAHMIERMLETVNELAAQGKRVGVLVPDHECPLFERTGAHVVSLGSTLAEIGYYLFARMRELDSAGVDVILTHGFEKDGLGLAIWDRLVRAAEGRVITG
jgi:L-threonylcarbamoyladenylate synthase